MGLHISKSDSSTHASTVRKRQASDDKSGATVSTEDSSVRGASSTRSGSTSDPQRAPPPNRLRLSQQTWRSGARSAPSFSPAHTRGQQPADTLENSAIPGLLRRDSDPGAPNERRSSVPVKCPPRKWNNNLDESTVGTTIGALSPVQGEDANYLMKMYDTRTWEMYRRITEARKNSSYSSDNNTANAKFDHTTATEDSTSGWENLQHDYTDSEGRHETIFLFDFD